MSDIYGSYWSNKTPENNYSSTSVIDDEYSNKPHGGSNLVWIVGVLIIVLLIAFFALIIIYFHASNTEVLHNIDVINNCSEPITIQFGTTGNVVKGKTLNPGQSSQLKATPGSNVEISGLGSVQVNNSKVTKLLLELAGNGFNNQDHFITDGTVLINSNGTNENNQDLYNVSVIDGFNIGIGITGSSGDQICNGPTWNYYITQHGEYPCPVMLELVSHQEYQGCLPPCSALCPNREGGFAFGCSSFCCQQPGSCSATGGCQSTWESQALPLYELFAESCPHCLILNCDKHKFNCSSEHFRNLSSYTVTFCPNLNAT